jgi:hypothetical protein
MTTQRKTPKKSKPKTNKKQSRAVAIRKEQAVKDLVNMFAGSSALVQNDKASERTLILRVAEAFAIPATCVNIMGGLPYINKDGLLFNIDEYDGKDIISLKTKMIEYAKKGGDRAIAEAELVLKGGREFNAVGEADQNSIKLSAVKQTPNMMAETRAQNRVIRRAIQARMLRDLYTKLGGKTNAYDDQEKRVIQNAIQSSAEEMTTADNQKIRAEIIEQTASPAQDKTISKKDLMKLSLDKIKAQTDPAELTTYYESINASPLYSPAQKSMLIGAIAEQRKKYARKN